jgi:hypothetical protein
MNIYEKLESILTEEIEALQPAVKKYTSNVITPVEKNLSDQSKEEFNTLKQNLISLSDQIHKDWLKHYLSDFEDKSKIKNIIKTDKSDMDKDVIEKYNKYTLTIYNIFKKFLTWKTEQKSKEVVRKKQKLNLAQIKVYISQGLTLGEIADKYDMPKSTLANKISSLYQTSYTDLKNQMNPKK